MSHVRLVAGFVAFLLIAAGAAGLVRSRSITFDTQHWIAAGPRSHSMDINDRWRMLDDLRARHPLQGLTYSEVCALLGPDDGGNCSGFDPAKAGVKLLPRSTTSGQQFSIVNPGFGPKCGLQHQASGRYSMFGGLAPHFMYKVRESWLLRLFGYQRTNLVLIFCRDGKVDDWILERGD